MPAPDIQTADDWIRALDLRPHPEGGFFAETYRSETVLPATALPEHFCGDRSASTGAYFLLRTGQISAFHRLRADELWHFHAGLALRLFMIDARSLLTTADLGIHLASAQRPQLTVPAGVWVAARPLARECGAGYSLCSCTVAPGFEFEDFELAKRDILSKLHPQHQELIFSFCHG